MMNQQAWLEQYDDELRINVEYPEARKEILPNLVRFVRQAPAMNFVSYSRLDPRDAGAIIEQQVDYFAPMNQPFEWIVFDHDCPADLKGRLEAAGFQPDEPAALMSLDLEKASLALRAPFSADIRQIAERERLADVIAVEAQVWGGNFDWIKQRLGDHMSIPGYLNVYVAYVDRQPVCSGWIYFHPNSQFASLWGGSTLPAYRSRGLYKALLAIRAQAAIARGYRFLTIEAGRMSRPIVARHGFELMTYTSSYGWKGRPVHQ